LPLSRAQSGWTLEDEQITFLRIIVSPAKQGNSPQDKNPRRKINYKIGDVWNL